MFIFIHLADAVIQNGSQMRNTTSNLSKGHIHRFSKNYISQQARAKVKYKKRRKREYFLNIIRVRVNVLVYKSIIIALT